MARSCRASPQKLQRCRCPLMLPSSAECQRYGVRMNSKELNLSSMMGVDFRHCRYLGPLWSSSKDLEAVMASGCRIVHRGTSFLDCKYPSPPIRIRLLGCQYKPVVLRVEPQPCNDIPALRGTLHSVDSNIPVQTTFGSWKRFRG